MRSRRLLTIAALLAAFVLLGCETNLPGSDVGHYTVNVPQTPMFRYGPAQSFGPDFSLTFGQHVVMLSRERGYSRVMTDDGQTGYVATEDLRPAPVTRPERSTPVTARAPSRGSRNFLPPLPPTGTGRPGVSSANNRVVEQGAPLFSGELPPLPAPGLDEPTTTEGTGPKPEFRHPKPKPGFRVNVPTPPAPVPQP